MTRPRQPRTCSHLIYAQMHTEVRQVVRFHSEMSLQPDENILYANTFCISPYSIALRWNLIPLSSFYPIFGDSVRC